jgi:hypothetical protein
MFQTKVAHKIKIHILCSITFHEYNADYVIKWEKMDQPGRAQMTI